MFDDAEIETQFIAVAQSDQRRSLHIGFFGQPGVQQDHAFAGDGWAFDGRVDEIHDETVEVFSA